jgi:dolichyl-phosphate-mannose-protein mannosyltransferase
MKRFFSKVPLELGLLIIGAAITRLIGINYPKATVFDEVYFKSFAADYFNHSYYFDQHPPLSKLILAAWAWLFRMHPDSTGTFAASATPLRVLVALTGITIIPLTYVIVKRLSKSRLAAGLTALIVMLNGALIVESRLVLINTFLVAFGLAAVYCSLRWRERRTKSWFIWAALFSGASASIKWTGLTAILLVLCIVTIGYFERGRSIAKWFGGIALTIIIGSTVYVSCFWIHFHILNSSGPGDAFMSSQFQATLKGNPYYSPSARLSFPKKFIELNKEMYDINATLTASHPYSSKWYTWPFEQRPIYYWEGTIAANGDQGNIYLISNPIIWWLTSVAVVIAIGIVTIPSLRRRYRATVPTLIFLLVAYLINWLPFAKIGRVMFLYHYFFGFIYAAMLLAIIATTVVPDNQRSWYRNPRSLVAIILILLTIGGYLYFLPLTYGIPISLHMEQARQWFSSWR